MPEPANEVPVPGRWPGLRLRWFIWAVFVAAWTTALRWPGRDIPWSHELALLNLKVLVAKSVHISAYALFAVLCAWLHVTSRFRWLLMYFMAVHAAGTEFIQLYVPGRSGEVYDVGFDLIGVAVGCGLTWKWWCDPA
jgi:VanZ family protein